MANDQTAGLVVGTGDFVYDVVRPWGTLPAGWSLGLVSHVAVDSRDRVYFYQRKDPPVLVFDADGQFLSGWGSQRLRDAHGIFIGPDDRVSLQPDSTRSEAHPGGSDRAGPGPPRRPSLQAPFNHPPTSPCRRPANPSRTGTAICAPVLGRGAAPGLMGRPGHARFTTPHVWGTGRTACWSPTRRTIGQLFSPEGTTTASGETSATHGHLRRRWRHGLCRRPDPADQHVLPDGPRARGPAGPWAHGVWGDRAGTSTRRGRAAGDEARPRRPRPAVGRSVIQSGDPRLTPGVSR